MAWGSNGLEKAVESAIVTVLDNGSRLQAPAVATYIERTRRAHPAESPTDTVARLERAYLTAVTGSGSAVGATAAIPGVGTVSAITVAGAETLFFLEASALFTLALAAIHGVDPSDAERRRALVLAVVLGEGGREIVERTVGRSFPDWGKLLSTHISGMSTLNESLLRRFMTRFMLKRGALTVGKIIPAGIGAAIGGVGNRMLGKTVIANAHTAFGVTPQHWPVTVIDAEIDDRSRASHRKEQL